MYKRILASVATVAAMTVASNAMASQARQLVLGTMDPFGILSRGTHGSFLIDDNLNSLYNPAYAAQYKNWASIEKATGYPGSNSSAEGGFVYDISGFSLGIYLNRQDALQSLINGPTNYRGGASNPARPFDLFVGADMGVKWGLGVSYANTKLAQDNNSATDLTVRGGLEVAGFEPFASFKITGTDTQSATVQNKNKSYSIGTKYRFGEWVPFAAYRMDKLTPQAGDDQKSSAFGAGFGRNMKVAEGAMLNYGVAYWRDINKNVGTSGDNYSVLPVDVSIEADATSWLVVRAGIDYHLIDQKNGLTQNAQLTTGRLGAGFKLGKATLDWAVGSSGTAPAPTTGNVDSPAFDVTSGFFSVASLTYMF